MNLSKKRNIAGVVLAAAIILGQALLIGSLLRPHEFANKPKVAITLAEDCSSPPRC